MRPPPPELLPKEAAFGDYSLPNASREASITSQHTGTELSEGKFSKPYDPFLGVFLRKPFLKLLFLSSLRMFLLVAHII